MMTEGIRQIKVLPTADVAASLIEELSHIRVDARLFDIPPPAPLAEGDTTSPCTQNEQVPLAHTERDR